MRAQEFITEKKWSGKYKKSINCSHPKGFSQKAHCAGRKKSNESVTEAVCPDCGLCESHGLGAVSLLEACWPGYRKDGMKTMFGKRYPNCVKKKKKSESIGQQGVNPRTGKRYITLRSPLTPSVAEVSCPRTRAAECSCASVNQLAESKETVTAVCVLEHSDQVKGTILFKQRPDGPTFVVGKITGLKPGEHGFHIHEFGDLSGGCETAGKHYNPDGEDHGNLTTGHVGDLGNITADSQGRANFTIVAERVDLSGDRSVVGRAVVVHENEDDLGQGGDEESLKTGNAGERLACGVITLKETIKENINLFRSSVAETGRVARKAGQPANSKKHSDLYTDENPRGTITGLKFATPEDARASVSKIRNSGRSHAHKIQAAVAMEQRAKAAGKAESAAVYRRYINANKKTESVESELETIKEDLRKWFKQKWVRFGPDGKIRGDCARGSSKEGKPKCLPQAKAHALGKKGRAKAGARKRREDPDANRSGKAINVKTK